MHRSKYWIDLSIYRIAIILLLFGCDLLKRYIIKSIYNCKQNGKRSKIIYICTLHKNESKIVYKRIYKILFNVVNMIYIGKYTENSTIFQLFLEYYANFAANSIAKAFSIFLWSIELASFNRLKRKRLWMAVRSTKWIDRVNAFYE